MARSLLAILSGILLVSCETPNIPVSQSLMHDASIYEVSGRQGLQINQIIKYGTFESSKVRRGWTHRYEIPFVLRFEGASEKLSFTQYIPADDSADVISIGRFKNIELPLLDDFFGIPLQYKDYFAGSIVNEHLNWNFIIYEPDGRSISDTTRGEIVNQYDMSESIQIRAIKEIEGQANWIQIDAYGFEFFKSGKSIGAVSLLNNGRVWIANDLDSKTKLIISSVMTGLLVRHSLFDE